MKIQRTTTVLTLTLLALMTTFAFAGDEPEVKVQRHVKIALAGDGEGGTEAIAIDVENLEIGESRQFFTDSGKEVLLTRTEGGYALEVDGKEIDLGLGGHHALLSSGDHAKAQVFLHKMKDDGEESEHVFIHHGEGEGFHWVSGGSEDVKVVMVPHGQHTSALEHLRDKGILDELDEGMRQKIVAALEELEHGCMHRKTVVVKLDEEAHETDDDEN